MFGFKEVIGLKGGYRPDFLNLMRPDLICFSYLSLFFVNYDPWLNYLSFEEIN